jgi:glycine cleavage system H lipoate-binding protein
MVALYVLLGFILLLIIDAFVIRAEKKYHPAFKKKYEIIEDVVFDNISVSVPADSFISKGHTWAELLGNGLVKIGIDEFVLKSVGKFIVTKISKPGTLIKKGDPVIEVKLGEKILILRSPIDGTINYINDNLIGKNISDPYGEDWGAILSPANFDKNAASLQANENVVEWMKSEFLKLKSYLKDNVVQHCLLPDNHAQLAGATMFDGGKIVEGAVSQLNQESIKKFEDEFLTV